MVYLWIIVGFDLLAFLLLVPFFAALGVAELAVRGLGRLSEQVATSFPIHIAARILAAPKFVVMILKNIRRNLLRSSLAYLAVSVMVLVITLIWSVLGFLDAVTANKSANFRALVTEKFQVPSQMPPRYQQELTQAALTLPPEVRPDPVKDMMAWTFVLSSPERDQSKWNQDNILFFFAMDPRALLTMMDELEQENLPPDEAKEMRDNVEAMQKNLKGIIVGREKLQRMNKKVGDKFTIYCNKAMYKDLEFEVEVVGTFPKSVGRYDNNAILNLEYHRKALDAYERTTGKAHPMANRCLNLFWIRVKNEDTMKMLADIVEKPGRFSAPSVKLEKGSAAISTFLDAYKDIFAWARYLLVPACMVVMMLVIAGAIAISVRERRPEMAVLKVLGFQPWQILLLVVGEATLVGALSGGLATYLTYTIVNAVGGIPFGIAFFPKFFVPAQAIWWGPVLGAFASVVGSIVPAWNARSVKVSEVFANVA